MLCCVAITSPSCSDISSRCNNVQSRECYHQRTSTDCCRTCERFRIASQGIRSSLTPELSSLSPVLLFYHIYCYQYHMYCHTCLIGGGRAVLSYLGWNVGRRTNCIIVLFYLLLFLHLDMVAILSIVYTHVVDKPVQSQCNSKNQLMRTGLRIRKHNIQDLSRALCCYIPAPGLPTMA